MRIVLFTLIFLNLDVLFAQSTFSKSLDVSNSADSGLSLVLTQEGYVILAGSICEFDCTSIIGTDYYGNIIWKRQIESDIGNIKPADNYANHAILINKTTNDIYISGIVNSFLGDYNSFLLKLNSTGDTIWQKNYGGLFDDINSTVIQTSDTSLVLFSDIGLNESEDEIWLLFTDLEGHIIRDLRFNSEYGMLGRQDIIHLNSNEIVFTYIECSNNFNCGTEEEKSLVVVKINESGEELWKKEIYNFTEYWSNSSILALDNGGFVVSFYEFRENGNWYFPPILIWLDALGNVISISHFPNESESLINDLVLSNDGEIIAVGSIDKFKHGYAGWIFSLNQSGDLLWNREIVDNRYPVRYSGFNSVINSENGGYLVTGSIIDTFENHFPSYENQNIWLVKLDDNGCLNENCSDFQIVTAAPRIANDLREFEIYPAIFRNTLNYHILNVSLAANNYSINVIDISGKLIMTKSLKEGYSGILDMSLLEPGVYIIQVIINYNKIIYVNKFVKM